MKTKLVVSLLVVLLSFALIVLAQTEEKPNKEAGVQPDWWTRIGTLVSSVGAILGMCALLYAVHTAIRGQKSFAQLSQNLEEQRKSSVLMNKRLEEQGENVALLYQNLVAMNRRLEKQGESMALLHQNLVTMNEELNERLEKQRKNAELLRQNLVAMNKEFERRSTISDVLLRVYSPAAELFLSYCKNEAQKRGYLNLHIRPKVHYEINQKGRDFLNELSPNLQERIATIMTEVEETNYAFFAQLGVDTLYDLVSKYNEEHDADLTVYEAIGTIATFAVGGTNLKKSERD